ncbi:hypothetical protein PR048_005184 [Dryococelus australis]|uniref:Uncharacterized protein n=1 Tax=Dryococelus australis TaxID=614101 RepID=A0ABQ9I7G8_9NEOP|nr:hypothetical protein PR048_005184 [Dryococelus australis]
MQVAPQTLIVSGAIQVIEILLVWNTSNFDDGLRSTRTGYNLRNTAPIDYRKNEYKVTIMDTSNITDPTALQGTGESVLTEFVHGRNEETCSVSSAEEFQAVSAAVHNTDSQSDSIMTLLLQLHASLAEQKVSLDEQQVNLSEQMASLVEQKASMAEQKASMAEQKDAWPSKSEQKADIIQYIENCHLSDNVVKHTDLAQITEYVRGQVEVDLRSLGQHVEHLFSQFERAQSSAEKQSEERMNKLADNLSHVKTEIGNLRNTVDGVTVSVGVATDVLQTLPKNKAKRQSHSCTVSNQAGTYMHRPSKLWVEQVPRFEGRYGENPINFLQRFEVYASVFGLPDADMLRCLSLSFRNNAYY